MQKQMDGKICLITGATSGIGLEIAGGLAKLGATVIITGRNEDIGKQIVEDIRKRTGNGLIELMIADFSTQDGVIKLADRIKERYDKLDVLINNAGLYQPDHTITSDGIEMTFAVNYLAPFLLSHLLLDLLRKGQPSRIVITASSWHKTGYLDFNDLNMNEKKYSGMQAYMNTKQALIMFGYTLAEKIKSMGVTVNTYHPGIVKTKLPRQRSFYSFLLKIIPFFLTPKQGAKTPIYLASSPEVEHITGKYFIRKKPVKSAEITYSLGLQKQLWDKSCELTKINGYEL